MATASSALSSIFSATANAATSVSTIFNTTTTGINMLHDLVDNAAHTQRLRYAINQDSVEQRLIEESSRENTERQLEIEAFCNTSPKHAELFNANYQRIKTLVDKRQGRI